MKGLSMKGLLRFAFAGLLLAGLCAGCGQKAATPAADGGQKTFTVGFDADFPPYGFKDGDEYKGFDLDLARAVCAAKGWEFVAKPINWDAKDMELNSGSIDCIWNGFTMQGREDAYEWTPAYVDNSQVVMVAADSDISALSDLAGKVVAVQTDTPVQKALSEGGEKAGLGATFKQLMVSPTYNNAVMELESGAVDAVALDIGVAKQKMADKPGAFKTLGEIVSTETYGIGFKKGNAALRDEVWAAYQALLADGTVDKLAAEYGIDGVIK
jgi:polar amino acid transport system substrate-binding protein